MAVIQEADESASTPAAGSKPATPLPGTLQTAAVKGVAPSLFMDDLAEAAAATTAHAVRDDDADEDHGSMTRLQRAFTRMLCSAVARVHRVMTPPPNAIPPPRQLPHPTFVHTALSSAATSPCSCSNCKVNGPAAAAADSLADDALRGNGAVNDGMPVVGSLINLEGSGPRNRMVSRDENDAYPVPKSYRHDQARPLYNGKLESPRDPGTIGCSLLPPPDSTSWIHVHGALCSFLLDR